LLVPLIGPVSKHFMARKRDRAPEPGVKIPLVIKIWKSTAFIAIDPANLTATKAVIAINLANLIPVPCDKAEPPPFIGDPPEFDGFLDRNFPRSKYAALRKTLDKPSPTSWGRFQRKSYSAAFPFAMLYQDEWRATRISFYREIVRLGKLLRAAAVLIDAVAQLKDERPQLRTCDCGKLFVPGRKDERRCSETCASRIRKAKQRESARQKRDQYKENRVQKEYEREKQRKAG
jgi:hypothetical protein